MLMNYNLEIEQQSNKDAKISLAETLFRSSKNLQGVKLDYRADGGWKFKMLIPVPVLPRTAIYAGF
jgi:hypothetical protein